VTTTPDGSLIDSSGTEVCGVDFSGVTFSFQDIVRLCLSVPGSARSDDFLELSLQHEVQDDSSWPILHRTFRPSRSSNLAVHA